MSRVVREPEVVSASQCLKVQRRREGRRFICTVTWSSSPSGKWSRLWIYWELVFRLMTVRCCSSSVQPLSLGVSAQAHAEVLERCVLWCGSLWEEEEITDHQVRLNQQLFTDMMSNNMCEGTEVDMKDEDPLWILLLLLLFLFLFLFFLFFSSFLTFLLFFLFSSSSLLHLLFSYFYLSPSPLLILFIIRPIFFSPLPLLLFFVSLLFSSSLLLFLFFMSLPLFFSSPRPPLLRVSSSLLLFLSSSLPLVLLFFVSLPLLLSFSCCCSPSVWMLTLSPCALLPGRGTQDEEKDERSVILFVRCHKTNRKKEIFKLREQSKDEGGAAAGCGRRFALKEAVGYSSWFSDEEVI